MQTVVFDGECTVNVTIDGDLGLGITQDGEYGQFTTVKVGDYYTGPMEATPSDEMQIYDTKGLLMPEAFVVNPIPSNYGRITWDGATLTVS